MKLRALTPVCVLTLTVLGITGAVGKGGSEIMVTDADSAKRALSNAAPGQIITFADGEYDLGKVTLTIAATGDKPLLLRAQHGGKARLVGQTGLVLRRAAYVTVEGFDWQNTNASPVAIEGSHHIRVTENRFHVTESGGNNAPTRRWVNIVATSIDGPPTNSHDNRVDHNLFENKNTPGNYIGISGLDVPGQKPRSCENDRIDHNYLRDIGPRIPNGMEAIRVGLSGVSLSSGKTVVEDNLFERCDGDPEVVSIKTCDATIRNNTFRDSQGGLCLRHGNRNTVSGNVFIGNGRKGTDGVRVYGDDHQIRGNYFTSLTGPAITVSNGNQDYEVDYQKGELPADRKILARHLRPRRITLIGNRIENCVQPIQLGAPFGDRTKQVAAQDIRFVDNTIVGQGTNGPLVQIRASPGLTPERLVWESNRFYVPKGADLGLQAGVAGISLLTAPPRLTIPPALTPNDVGPSWTHK